MITLVWYYILSGFFSHTATAWPRLQTIMPSVLSNPSTIAPQTAPSLRESVGFQEVRQRVPSVRIHRNDEHRLFTEISIRVRLYRCIKRRYVLGMSLKGRKIVSSLSLAYLLWGVLGLQGSTGVPRGTNQYSIVRSISIQKRTFTINDSQPISSNIKVTQSVDGSHVRQDGD